MKIALVGLLIIVTSIPCFAQTRDSERATELNNRAVALTDRDGNNIVTKEQIAEAFRLFEEAARLDPYDEIIVSNHASLFEEELNLKEALQLLDSFLTQRPYSRRIRSQRVSLLYSLRLSAEAYFENLKLIAEGINDGYGDLPKESPMAGIFSYYKTDKPIKTEFGLEGFFRQGNKDRLEFDAMVFALPNGHFQIMAPKRKQVLLNGLEPEYQNLGSIPVNQLKSGDLISIIGEEQQGKFVAHAISAAPRTREEQKKRGTLFDTDKLEMKDEQKYPENLKGMGTAQFLLKNGESKSSQTSTFIRDGNRTALVTSTSAFYLDNDRYQSNSIARFGADTAKKLATTQVINGLASLDDYYSEEKSKPPKLEVNLPVRISKPFAGGELIVADTNTVTDSLKLAASNPIRGENVYYAIYNEGAMEWMDATVAYSDTNRLVLHLLGRPDGDFLPGHPIVNHAGDVVGLQIFTDSVDVSGVSVDALRRAIHQPTK